MVRHKSNTIRRGSYINNSANLPTVTNSETDERNSSDGGKTALYYFILDSISEEDHALSSDSSAYRYTTTTTTQQSYWILHKVTILQLILLSILLGWIVGTGICTGNLSAVGYETLKSKFIFPWIYSSPSIQHPPSPPSSSQISSFITNSHEKKNLISKSNQSTKTWRNRLATRIRNSVLYHSIITGLRALHGVVRQSTSRNPFHQYIIGRSRSRRSSRRRTRNRRPWISHRCFQLLNFIWPWADWSNYDSIDMFYLDYESPLSSKRYASTYAHLPSFRSILLQSLFGNAYYRHTSSMISSSSSRNQQTKFTRHWTKLRDAGASHPLTFALLREMIRREPGGYVHPDIGVLLPAPSGSARGLGMVRDSYNECQRRCIPGIASEKLIHHHHQQQQQQSYPNHGRRSDNDNNNNGPPYWNDTTILHLSPTQRDFVIHQQQSTPPIYQQEEILLKIPLDVQMTRTVALHFLSPLIPADILQRAPLLELDDAILLALLLAHEAMKGHISIFWPYILSLPMHPTCAIVNGAVFNAVAVLMGGGAEPTMTAQENIWTSLQTMGITLGMDIQGWFEQTLKVFF